MTVRKKIVDSQPSGDTMRLSRHLLRVREAIKNLPTDEGANMQNDDTPGTAGSDAGSDASKTTVKKKPKKVVKKAAKKSTVKKVVKTATNQVTLAEVAKELKMEPRTARRILRNSKVKNPGRWAWDKGSSGLAAAKKALKESQADK